jgi:hypothetical protein
VHACAVAEWFQGGLIGSAPQFSHEGNSSLGSCMSGGRDSNSRGGEYLAEADQVEKVGFQDLSLRHVILFPQGFSNSLRVFRAPPAAIQTHIFSRIGVV